MTILICPTKKPDVYGDIAFMVNLANTLASSHLIRDDIIIVSKEKSSIEELFSQQLNNEIKLYSLEEADTLITNKEISPSLYIEGPTYSSLYSALDCKDPAIPTLYTAEYTESRASLPTWEIANIAHKEGKPCSVIFSGLCNYPFLPFKDFWREQALKTELNLPSSKEDGIFIDEVLIAKGESFLSNRLKYTRQVLTNLSDETKKVFSYAECSLENINLETSSFYFHYGNNPSVYNAYLRLIFAKNKEGNNNIIIVSVGESHKLNSSTLAWMKDAGYSHDDPEYNNVQEYSTSYDDYNSEGDYDPVKKLFIIKFDKLISKDFIDLMSIADKMVSVTGDHSMGRLYALMKMPFYEMRPHKKIFYAGYRHLLEELELNKLIQLQAYIYTVENINNNSTYVQGEIFKPTLDSIPSDLVDLLNTNLNEELKIFRNQIHENWNLGTNIIQRVVSLISDKFINDPKRKLLIEEVNSRIVKLEAIKSLTEKSDVSFFKESRQCSKLDLCIQSYQQLISDLIYSSCSIQQLFEKNKFTDNITNELLCSIESVDNSQNRFGNI